MFKVTTLLSAAFSLTLITINVDANTQTKPACFNVTNTTRISLNYQVDTNDAEVTTTNITNNNPNILDRQNTLQLCTLGQENNASADTLVALQNYSYKAKQIGLHLNVMRDISSSGVFTGNFKVAAVDWSDSTDSPLQHCWFEGHDYNETVTVPNGGTLKLKCRWTEPLDNV